MIRITAFAALAAMALLAPRSASAQLRIIPQVGLYAPFADLPSPSEAAEVGKKESTLAYGLAAELGQPDKVSFRLNVLYATDSEVPVVDVGCQSDCVRSTVATFTGALVVRPLPNIILVQPFLLAGAGVKRYDYTRQDLDDEGLRTLLNDKNLLTGHLGAGVEVNLGMFRLTGEISDLMSRFSSDDVSGGENDLQHDVFFTIGLVLGG